MGLPTPITPHLNDSEFSSVYEPAEDTYLLLDALEQDQEELQAMHPTICVEIGSGSGCASVFLSHVLDPVKSLIISTDINPAANKATHLTDRKNNSTSLLDPVRARFTNGLIDRLHNKVDVLMFNPPYVVTPSEEVDCSLDASAWAGGVNGREVLDLILPDVTRLLAPGGRFYLVVIEQNKPDELISILGGYGLKGENVISRKAGREHLSILRFIK